MALQFDFSNARAAKDRYLKEGPAKPPAKKTQQRQDRIWEAWEQWSAKLKNEFNRDQIWFDFVNCDDQAIAWIKSFLEAFFVAYVKPTATTGPEESEVRPRIKSGLVMRDYWNALVKVADTRYMKPKRTEMPGQAGYWVLTYSSRDKSTKSRPAHAISTWLPQLADRLGASRGQLFVKRAATSDDLIAIITTAWVRSRNVICTPRHRVDFSLAVQLGGIGGWRPEEFLQIKYEDVEIGWLRNPKDPRRPFTVCNITVHHIKLQDGIRTDQTETLTFWLAQVPDARYCALRKLILLALADNAFDEGYTDMDQVVGRTWDHDQTVHFIPARWKPAVLKRRVYELQYKQYLALWNCINSVLGMETEHKLRPYASRVGAGARLGGVLAPHVRNYILGHSSAMFQRSYQPRTVPDLQGIAFGEKAAGVEDILAITKTAFFRRDEQAPVYIPKHKWDSLEERSDIKAWRAELEALPSKSSKEGKRILGRIQARKTKLEKAILEEERERYFEEAKKLRERGLPTDHLHDSEARDPRKRRLQSLSDSASQIGQLLLDEPCSQEVHTRMLAYMQQRLGACPIAKAEEGQADKPRCLLGCGTFTVKESLSAHARSRVHKETFKQPFPCPECRRLGKEEFIVPAGINAWSSHVAAYHGKIHAPSTSEKGALCLLCDRQFTSQGLSTHLHTHISNGQFTKPFPCPKCKQDQGVDYPIQGLDDWEAHTWQFHNQNLKAGKAGKKRPAGVSPGQTLGERSPKRKKMDKEDSDKDLISLFANDEFFVTGRDEDYEDTEDDDDDGSWSMYA